MNSTYNLADWDVKGTFCKGKTADEAYEDYLCEVTGEDDEDKLFTLYDFQDYMEYLNSQKEQICQLCSGRGCNNCLMCSY